MQPSFDDTIILRDPKGLPFGIRIREVVKEILQAINLEVKKTEVDTVSRELANFFREKQPVDVQRFTEKAISVLSEIGLKIGLASGSGEKKTLSAYCRVTLDASRLVAREDISLDMHFSQAIVREARRLLREQPFAMGAELEIKNMKSAIKCVLARERWSRECSKLSDLIVEQARTVAQQEAAQRSYITLKIFP